MTSRHDLTPTVTTASVASPLTKPVDVSSPGAASGGVPPSCGEVGGSFGTSAKRPSGVVGVEPKRVRCAGCRGLGWLARNGALHRCRICHGDGRVVVRSDGTHRCGLGANLAPAVEQPTHAVAGRESSHLSSVGASLARQPIGEVLGHGRSLIPDDEGTDTRGHETEPTPEHSINVCSSCNGAGGYGEVMGGSVVWLGDCANCGGTGGV